jgi:hypothetical protein
MSALSATVAPFWSRTRPHVPGDPVHKRDQRYIAPAREDVPALLAEIERLRGLLSSGPAS